MRIRFLLVSLTILAGIAAGLALVWQGFPLFATLPVWVRLLFLAACIGIAVLEWKNRFSWALVGLLFAVIISVLYVIT